MDDSRCGAAQSVGVLLSLCLLLASPSVSLLASAETTETDEPPISGSAVTTIVSGARVELHRSAHDEAPPSYTDRVENNVRPRLLVRYVLFGVGLERVQRVAFTTSSCDQAPKELSVAFHDFHTQTDKRISLDIEFAEKNVTYKLCIQTKKQEENVMILVTEPRTWVVTEVPSKKHYFPVGIQYGIVLLLLTLSGLFSGLNLGLMALSPHELSLIQKSGSPTESKYAETIIPLRKNGNLLLCTLLIGNVFVNSGISILLDDLTSGYIALFVASACIVVFGEIFPQSLCVKKGLMVGAKTIWITRFFMGLTFPVAYPISKLLDCLLGDEVIAYDRKRLTEMIKSSMHGTDGKEMDNLRIAVGAMEISEKTVKDVMTRIDDVFMLPESTVLNTKTVAEILRMGYTRIPIYADGDRNAVVSLLFVKDLALLDPDDNFTIHTVCGYHNHELRIVFEDTPLQTMLEEFKRGDYHLAMVKRVVCSDDKDPSYELVGVITLEDILEEILQAEIVDETDTVIDNVNRTRRKDLAASLLDAENASRTISVQMQLVAVQFLTANYKAFTADYIALSVLEKLLRQHVHLVECTHLPDTYDPKAAIPRAAKLYTKGEFSERFILILEGRALVTIGQDSMTFEAGPWHAFGHEVLDKLVETYVNSGALTERSAHLCEDGMHSSRSSLSPVGFVPDYSVVIRDSCTFLEISAKTYKNARNATLLIQSKSSIEVGRNRSRTSIDGLRTAVSAVECVGVPNGRTKHLSQSDVEDSERMELLHEVPPDTFSITSH